VPDNGGVAEKRKRGLESTGDMIRSLGLVMAIVVVVFWLAKPPASDAKRLRVVDPTGDVKAFSQAVPGVPVPGALPTGWRSTVSDYRFGGSQLRVGWVTPAGEYAEYAANAAPPETFLEDITGRAPRTGTVVVDGVTWTEYRRDEAISLVRTYGATTVVLGTLRNSSSLEELRVLAGSLTR
jgi:hypothetical protein